MMTISFSLPGTELSNTRTMTVFSSLIKKGLCILSIMTISFALPDVGARVGMDVMTNAPMLRGEELDG